METREKFTRDQVKVMVFDAVKYHFKLLDDEVDESTNFYKDLEADQSCVFYLDHNEIQTDIERKYGVDLGSVLDRKDHIYDYRNVDTVKDMIELYYSVLNGYVD